MLSDGARPARRALLLAVALAGCHDGTTTDVGSCIDGLRNEGESDVDCGGGSVCERCSLGAACALPRDCQSHVCVAGACAKPGGLVLAFDFGELPLAGNALALAAGDLDGNGAADLAAALIDYRLAVALQSGAGLAPSLTFATAATGNLRAADLDGDGRADLIVTDPTRDTVTVVLSTPAGTPGVAVDHPAASTPWGIAVADMDEDGHPDVVVAAPSAIGIYHNEAGTLAAPVGVAARGAAHDVVAADFDRDGHVDLVASDAAAGGLLIYLGDGKGGVNGPGVAIPLTGKAVALVAGDLDHDGIVDLVTSDGATITILFGRGNGIFDEAIQLAAAEGVGALALGDFNSDDNLDLASAATSELAVFLGNGNRTFRDPTLFPIGVRTTAIVAADWNGDGKPDVAVGEEAGLTLALFYNTSS